MNKETDAFARLLRRAEADLARMRVQVRAQEELCTDLRTAMDVVRGLTPPPPPPERETGQQRVIPLAEASAEAEMNAIRVALSETGGRKADAAKLLGISRKHLWELIKRHGMERGAPER